MPKRSLIAAILWISLLTVPAMSGAQEAPPGNEGVVSILTGIGNTRQICTGVIVKKRAATEIEPLDFYWALTAGHCVKGGPAGMTVRYVGTPSTTKWIGAIRLRAWYKNRDLALVGFYNERGLEDTWGTAKLSPRMPKPGETIWGKGVAYWSLFDPQIILTSKGTWIGTPLKRKGGQEESVIDYLANISVSKGWSGGPLYVEGKVFGVYVTGYTSHQDDEPEAPLAVIPEGHYESNWSGIAILGTME